MGRRWTKKDAAAHQAKVKGEESPHEAPGNALRKVRVEPKALKEMKQWLRLMKIEFVTEYRFLPDRQFRFDIAIPSLKIGIEYEGLISEKSRHTTIAGYSNDATKYNLAQLAGWRVLRYTAKNYRQLVGDISAIIHPQNECK